MTSVTTEALESFFIGYGEALAAGDLPGISGCYAEPAFLLSDATGRVLADRAQIEGEFDGAAEQHRAEDLVAARPTIVAVEQLGAELVSVDVHWDYVDVDGRSMVEDGYRYILRVGDDGRPQICTVVVTPERLRRG